jgi:hypothetical protein
MKLSTIELSSFSISFLKDFLKKRLMRFALMEKKLVRMKISSSNFHSMKRPHISSTMPCSMLGISFRWVNLRFKKFLVSAEAEVVSFKPEDPLLHNGSWRQDIVSVICAVQSMSKTREVLL